MRNTVSAVSTPASVAALAKGRNESVASVDAKPPFDNATTQPLQYAMDSNPSLEGYASNLHTESAAYTAATVPSPVPIFSYAQWPYDGTEQPNFPPILRWKNDPEPFTFEGISADKGQVESVHLNSSPGLAAQQEGLTSFDKADPGKSFEDTMKSRLEALVIEADRRFRSAIHVDFLLASNGAAAHGGGSLTESPLSLAEAQIENDEDKEAISDAKVSSDDSVNVKSDIYTSPNALALQLACKGLINRMARIIASSTSKEDDISYDDGLDNDRIEMKKVTTAASSNADASMPKYQRSLDAMLTSFFTQAAKDGQLSSVAFEHIPVVSNSLPQIEKNSGLCPFAQEKDFEIKARTDHTHELQHLAKILEVSWPGAKAICGDSAEVNLWEELPKNTSTSSEGILQTLLAKVDAVSQATALDGITSLHLLSLPETSWDAEKCLESFFERQASHGARTESNVIYWGRDEGVTWSSPSYVCSSLYASEGGSNNACAKAVPINCTNCNMSDKANLFSLSCMHWYCRECWETSLRGQLEAKHPAGLKILTCPCCTSAVPPKLTNCIFPVSSKDRKVIETIFVKAYAQSYTAWYHRKNTNKALGAVVRREVAQGKDREARSTNATEGLDGATNTPRGEFDLISVNSDAVWVGDDRVTTNGVAAGASDALAALNSGGSNYKGSRWRSLLFLASSAYQTPFASHVAQEASSSLDHSIRTDVTGRFPRDTQGTGSSANTTTGKGLGGIAQPTFHNLYEKFYNQHRSLLFKEGSLHSDANALTSSRLKIDACDLLAKAYLMLDRIHQISCSTSHTPSKYLKRSIEPNLAWIGDFECLTPSAIVLLEPLRMYTTALSKAMETIAVQSHPETGALKSLRQLLHAVRMHQMSVNRIPASVWAPSYNSSQEVAKCERSRSSHLKQIYFPHVGQFGSNLDEVFGSNPFSVFMT